MVIQLLALSLAVAVGWLLGILMCSWLWRTPKHCKTCGCDLKQVYLNWSTKPTWVHTERTATCWRWVKEGHLG